MIMIVNACNSTSIQAFIVHTSENDNDFSQSNKLIEAKKSLGLNESNSYWRN